MFLELQLWENDERIIVNIKNINTIYTQGGMTMVYVGEAVYRIKESYSEVIDAINSYYSLGLALG